jgi:hypothetical protein
MHWSSLTPSARTRQDGWYGHTWARDPLRWDESGIAGTTTPRLDMSKRTQEQTLTYSSGKAKTYLFFVLLGESFLSPSTTFLLRGSGLWTKVHSCLWNSHKTHSAAPSCITQRLFLRLQASHGRSLRERMLETGPLVEVGLPTTRFSLPGEGFCCLRGRAAAIGTGIGRGIAGCIAMAVVISLSGADDALKR